MMYYPPETTDPNMMVSADGSELGAVGLSEEDYGNAEYVKINTVVMDGGEQFGVSCVAFDLNEELVWVGNNGGHATSYYSQGMEKYTSFQVHASQDLRQIVPMDDFILFLSQTQLRGQIRRGIPVFTHMSEYMQDLQCMLATSPYSVVMGGHQNELIEFDLHSSRESRIMHLPPNMTCGILRCQLGTRYIFGGDPNGSICFLDSRGYKTEHVIEAHSGCLSDFDVQGNLLTTCGFSAPRLGGLSLDRYIKVYDIRSLRAMAPIQVSVEPLLLRFIPSFSSRLVTVSSTGQMEILETQAVSHSDICIYNVTSTPTAACSNFDISSNCTHMVFGDTAGYVTLFASPNSDCFNAYSKETEFADPLPEPINIESPNSNFAMIPMYYGLAESGLASDWPEELMERVYRPAPPVNPNILNSIKMVGTIGYAPNPGLFKRNQVMYKMHEHKQVKKSVKKMGQKIPKRYMKTNYVNEDLENKYCGLDGNLVNSYCNPVLQSMCHVEFLKNSLMNHYCSKDCCLSCELGFLFKNMNSNVSISGVGNLLRVFRMVPEASALGLILTENVKSRTGLLRTIQNWNRFILHQVEGEMAKDSDPISKLFAMKQENMNRCTKCGREEKKQSTVLLSNLMYSSEGDAKRCNFVEVLQRSLCPQQTTPAWCERCEKYQATCQSRIPQELPQILSLNTCLDNAHDYELWKTGLESTMLTSSPNSNVKPCRYGHMCTRIDCRFWHEEGSAVIAASATTSIVAETGSNPDLHAPWIPQQIKVTVEDNTVRVVDGAEDANYELFSVVVFVKEENEEKCNLIAITKLNEEWILFNDHIVRQVKTQEATNYNPKWKIPAIVYFRKKSMPPPPPLITKKIPFEVFRHTPKQKYKTLTKDETIQMVALDAEFVTLGQEETELRSDGKLATIKPQQLSVARVTVVRENGQPVIDDYISTQEVVVDYLTKFSGIQPGDLDANYSTKNVTSMKAMYSKLLYLVENQVKFVGHGISNDFRVINLVVPPEQVIDTVTLFYLPSQRMMSLKFLAWHFLGMNIQTEIHDSLEDARAALYLYRKYEELKKAGTADKAVEDMYEKAKLLNWKVPV